MHILVTGGTGFIGQALCPALRREGHQVTVLTRDRANARQVLPDIESASQLGQVSAVQAVINLAGEPLTAGRWNASLKQRFRESRLGTTHALHDWIAQQPPSLRPACLLSGSAIGYYGDGGDQCLSEDSPTGDDFAAELCRDWEAEARSIAKLGPRVTLVRTGIVLGTDGGALAKMLPAFRLGGGARMGNGRHWMSWIHRADMVALLLWLLEHGGGGAYNATAPEPATNTAFTASLAKVLHRPALLAMPGAALRLMFGEMADLLLVSQRVLPQRAEREGFRFRYRELEPALHALLD